MLIFACMKTEDIKRWLRSKHPTTIVNDRYSGIYSEAQWLAFPLEHYDVPAEVDGDDMTCVDFWQDYAEPVGKGDTPDEALRDLVTIMDGLVTK